MGMIPHDPLPESDSESVPDPESDSESEPTPFPRPSLNYMIPQTGCGKPKCKPKVLIPYKSAPKPAPAPDPESDPESDPKPTHAPESDPKPAHAPESDPEPVPETDPAPALDPELEPTPAPESDSDSEPESDSDSRGKRILRIVKNNDMNDDWTLLVERMGLMFAGFEPLHHTITILNRWRCLTAVSTIVKAVSLSWKHHVWMSRLW